MSGHTPGPWAWEVTPSGEVRLHTPDRGKLYVMGFARQGMRGAQPRFSLWGDGPRERRGGIMHGFVEAGGAGHPDARLIAAAPDGLIAGTDLLDVVKAAIRSGDWKVDGACDPDAAIRRMEQFIAKATGASA